MKTVLIIEAYPDKIGSYSVFVISIHTPHVGSDRKLL